MRSTIITIAAVAILAACGGSYEPDESVRVVNAASYEQTAPAGSLTIGVGELKAERQIVAVTHTNTNDRPARITLAASTKNVQAIGAVAKGGMRWEVRASGLVFAQGVIPPGNEGAATFDVDVEYGVTAEIAIVAFVESTGPAAGVTWDGAKVVAGVK